MKARLSSADEIRTLIRQGHYDEAARLFEQLGPASAGTWWLQLERARAMRRGHLSRGGKGPIRLLYTPHYRSNHYQTLLHAALVAEGSEVMAVDAADLASLPDAVLRDDRPFLFHQHWLGEIYRGLRADADGFAVVDRYFGMLRLLRALGGKVFWTVHNLFDHDTNADEQQLNRYCLEQMAKLADRILIHGTYAQPLLETACGLPLGDRCRVLPHPLYDFMLALEAERPPELHGQDSVALTYLCFGLLRPYKGGLELLRHYISGMCDGQLANTRLIFAGVIQDKALLREYASAAEAARRHIVLINRQVSDGELAWLCRHADVAVLPYRDILTSGSFYQTATFALPAIVPATGMFASEVEDGVNGLRYDRAADLGTALVRAKILGRPRLREMGERALARCLPRSSADKVAIRYRDLVRQVLLDGEAVRT